MIHRSPGIVQGAFEDPYWSARVAALGGAFTAVSDDASQVFYNSAAGAMVRERQVDFTYAKLFSGLEDVNFSLNYAVFHQPIGQRTAVGAGWGNLSTNYYKEHTFAVSFSQDLTPWIDKYGADLSAGITLKYLTRKFDLDERTQSDLVFKEGSRTHNAAVDLHLYSVPNLSFFPGLSLGLSIKSINRPNIDFKKDDPLPTEVSGGLAYRYNQFLFPLDVSSDRGKTRTHLGLERSLWQNRMVLRLGSDLTQIGTGFGYHQPFFASFGLHVDYTFLWPLELRETYGSHRITLGMKF